MTKYVAFLRAINVGGHTVKMDELRRLFEEIGLANVETFIASGNVIFDSPSRSARALEKKIEAHLQASLSYAVAAFVRSISELAAVARYQPYKDTNANLYIAFTAQPPGDAAKKKLDAFTTPLNEFHVHGCEVYWLSRTLLSESTFSAALLEKTLGTPATLRNATTVRRLAAKYK